MRLQRFDEPVQVLVGLGFPRQINSVVDAYQFAVEYCGNSPEKVAAMRACKAALMGEIDAQTARGIFVAFVRRKDILVEGSTLPPLTGAMPQSHV